MRSLLLLSFAVLALGALGACGDIVPAAIDAAPGTCVPACGANATCTGTTCACDTGYEGDGLTCTDVDECLTNNGGCDANAACFNTDGGRNCGCNTGYVGDGVTCRQVWAPRGSAQIRLANVVTGQNNDAVAVAAGNRIFFGPDLGGADDPNHFMRSFDISTMTFAGPHSIPPANSRDFCACGYTEVFVSNGSDLFMFGNFGYRYRTALDRWEPVMSYSGSFQRGEAAGAFETNNGLIFMIGGRGPLNDAIRFNVSTAVFGPEPGTLPFSLDGARAWAPAGNNITYVAGGFASDNNRQHFLSHATGTPTWTTLPDVPTSIGTPTGMGDWQGKIWVTSRSNMYFFDVASGTWGPGITLPGGFVTAVTAGNPSRVFGLFQLGDTLQVQELMAIE